MVKLFFQLESQNCDYFLFNCAECACLNLFVLFVLFFTSFFILSLFSTSAHNV